MIDYKNLILDTFKNDIIEDKYGTVQMSHNFTEKYKYLIDISSSRS